MTLTPYRETLALRGIRSLLIVATLGRIPVVAGTVTLTLHVVLDLKLGYGPAGLVGAMFTIGGSLGAPVMGRISDRRGLRPVLILTTIAEAVFWTTGQALPYWALVVAALVGGFLTLPVFSIARQSIAALAPESHRLPAFALDSMTTELSFMAGPALGVFVATTAGPRIGMFAVGGGIVLSGILLFVVNPPIRGRDEAPISAADRVPRRTWLKPRLLGILGITSAATLVLSGTDVAVVAILRASGEIAWVGLVMAIWATYSLLGGFLYGTIRRGLPPVALLLPMALLTIPIGLVGGTWWLLAIVILPAGALCAPTITATADAVSRMTPASARGEAMGLHNSSLTVGVALGAPLAGAAMDAFSPAWGFATVGAAGLLIALLVLPGELRRRKNDAALALDGESATDQPTDLSRTDLSGADLVPADRYAADLVPADRSTADSPHTGFSPADRSSADRFRGDLSPADRFPEASSPSDSDGAARRDGAANLSGRAAGESSAAAAQNGAVRPSESGAAGLGAAGVPGGGAGPATEVVVPADDSRH